MVAEDGLECTVARQEPGVTVAASKDLDGRLPVKHRGHNVAVRCIALLPDNHEITVADRGINHRISNDTQHKQVAVSDERAGQGHEFFDVLIGGNRHTRGNLTDKWNVGGLFCLHRREV